MKNKPDAPTLQSKDLVGTAMLVKVNLSLWEARKHDPKVTDQVNKEHAAGKHAGRYHKHLFGGPVEELSAVITAHHYLRDAYMEQTLPWLDSGWRLLPTANYFTFADTMREKSARFFEAVDVLVAAYPRLHARSKTLLNGMWNAADYPAAGAVRGKYGVEIDYAPLPMASDFRVDLPAAELARMAKTTEDRTAKQLTAAMQEAWKRLGDAVAELKEKLDVPKHLRQTMFDRIRELAETLGRLNVTHDPTLETARQEVLKHLGSINVEVVKGNDTTREEKRAQADAILNSMRGFYAPQKGDK